MNSLIIFVVMRVIKQLFDFYINSSIHVAFALLSLVLMTNHMFHISSDLILAGFSFFGTILGYNFVKYESLLRSHKSVGKQLKAILVLSFVSFIISVFCFFKLKTATQIAGVVFFGLTLLYTVPFFFNKRNVRNWSGVKIYIVAFCWAGITIFLPLLNADIPVSMVVCFKFSQRFLLIIVLILIFEIVDLKKDALSLMTVPQRIGVKQTKIVALLLLIPFYFLEFLKNDFNKTQLWINLILIVITAFFIILVHPNRSKYYTSFWVESVPIFWLLMVVFAQ